MWRSFIRLNCYWTRKLPFDSKPWRINFEFIDNESFLCQRTAIGDKQLFAKSLTIPKIQCRVNGLIKSFIIIYNTYTVPYRQVHLLGALHKYLGGRARICRRCKGDWAEETFLRPLSSWSLAMLPRYLHEISNNWACSVCSEAKQVQVMNRLQ